jgi:hypothetical protein
MKTIEIKLYQFSELSEKAKEKALENFHDINVDYGWSDFTIEEITERLNELGFNEAKVMFSGFWSQGDGACFTCESIDFKIFLDGKYKELADSLSCYISHNWRHYFATSTTVNLESYDEKISDDLFSSIEQDIERERERLGNMFYKELEQEYEYQTSKEAIIETIEANEYDFLESGKRPCF